MNNDRAGVLVLTPRVPYPPYDGFNVRVWQLYRCAAKNRPHTILGIDPGEGDPVSAGTTEAHFPGITLMNAARNSGKQPASSLEKLFFSLRGFPMWTLGLYDKEVEATIRQLIAARPYQVIVLESTWMGVYQRALESSRCLKILDMHDLEGEKILRQARLMPLGSEKLKYLINAFQFKLLEKRLLRTMDRILVTSEREYARLKSKHPDADIHVVANGVDCENITPLPPHPESRDILFVGRLGYYPNQEGILYFAKDILPRLRRRFNDLRLWVVGGDVTAEVLNLNKSDGITVTGRVEDLRPYYERCAVCIVPLRAGSGTRLKILEAMAYGRPVVSTSLGCEGLGVADGRHLLVADDSHTFAEAVARLFQDSQQVDRLVNEARSFVEANFCWQAIADKVSDLYHP